MALMLSHHLNMPHLLEAGINIQVSNPDLIDKKPEGEFRVHTITPQPIVRDHHVPKGSPHEVIRNTLRQPVNAMVLLNIWCG